MYNALTDDLYNKETKEDFLKEYPEPTQVSYRRIFSYSSDVEKKYQKDLYNFNAKELGEVLLSLKPSTKAVSRTNGRIVTAYITWAHKQKYSSNKFNPLVKASNGWFNKFVDENILLYISEKQLLQEIMPRCANSQDAAIFMLLFEGAQGKGCAELTNLKEQDVDFDNKLLTLKDADGSIRENFAVSQRCIDYIRKALDEKDYKKKNGEMDTTASNVRDFTELVSNDYVLRNSITKTDNYLGSVDKHTIYRRIKVIRESLGYPLLNAKNIARSGMLKMAHDLKKEHGELEKEQLQVIADRYAVKNIWSLKDFINAENIERLYKS